MKIMVVDDSAAMRTLIRRMLLSFEGRHQVVEARDGRHALAVFKKERPRIILLDWDMPSVSGIDFLRSFQQPNTPVTIGMVTANHGIHHQRIAKQMGAAFLLPKPFVRAQLWQALAPYLERSVTGEQLAVGEPSSRSGYGFEAAVLDSLNLAFETAVSRANAVDCAINGSAGMVCSLLDLNGKARFVIGVDWPLCHFLNAGFSGSSGQNISAQLAARRTTPQLRENLKEIANIIRGVCRTRLNEDMEFGPIAYRGDGELRSEYWRQLLASRSFKTARHYPLGVRVAGIGTGGLSIHQLSDNN